MDNKQRHYLESLMRQIPGGKEVIRDHRDDLKWISSDSKMSMPGQKGRRTLVEKMVDVKPFQLASYPVTKGMYNAFVNRMAEGLEADKTPMVNVSWYDAVTFCNRLSREWELKECYTFDHSGVKVTCDWEAGGFRLPTDAEWQYACRGGSTGYQYGEIGNIAWYADNAEGSLHEVGQKHPNLWGLYDMLGNAWEWCWDLYDEKTYGEYRIFRGGSWAEEARGCGATSRRRGHPTFKIDDLGFRLAR